MSRIAPNEGAPANRHPLPGSAMFRDCLSIGRARYDQVRVPVAELGRSAPRARAVDRENFLVSFFLCDLSGRGVRRFFSHAEDAKDAKAGAGAPWHRRPSRRVRRNWPEIFEIE